MATVLVTGASRGIGAAIAKRLASDGFDIALNYKSNKAKALEIASECRSFGVAAEIYQADVSDYGECETMIKEITQSGGIYGLVNNAGINRDSLIMRMSVDMFDEVIAADLKSVFNLCKLVSPIMLKQRGGRIINISSVSGVFGNAGQVNYASAKAGILGLTKSLAKELGSRGITVNAIAPGFIETDMTESLSGEILEKALEAIPLKRLGKPEDVAGAVSFLISDSACYITGQTLVVSGGLVI